jgi:hypothetical protein
MAGPWPCPDLEPHLLVVARKEERDMDSRNQPRTGVGRACRLLLAALVGALAAVMAGPLSVRADMPMAGKALVRLVDLASDGATADFYVDGVRDWQAVSYKTVSNYVELDPGSHLYEVRKAGSPASSIPLARIQQTVEAASFYSVLAAGWGESLRMSVYRDGSSAMPMPEYCEARFINASPDLDAIDFEVHGLDANFTRLPYMAASSYGKLPKGVYDVEMRDSQSKLVITTIRDFVAPGGHMHTLVAAGGLGRPVELVEFYDAMTADQVPSGGADTGSGGLSALPALAALTLLPVLLTGSALFVAGRARFEL